jgi:hypothetical protein
VTLWEDECALHPAVPPSCEEKFVVDSSVPFLTGTNDIHTKSSTLKALPDDHWHKAILKDSDAVRKNGGSRLVYDEQDGKKLVFDYLSSCSGPGVSKTYSEIYLVSTQYFVMGLRYMIGWCDFLLLILNLIICLSSQGLNAEVSPSTLCACLLEMTIHFGPHVPVEPYGNSLIRFGDQNSKYNLKTRPE